MTLQRLVTWVVFGLALSIPAYCDSRIDEFREQFTDCLKTWEGGELKVEVDIWVNAATISKSERSQLLGFIESGAGIQVLEVEPVIREDQPFFVRAGIPKDSGPKAMRLFREALEAIAIKDGINQIDCRIPPGGPRPSASGNN